MPCSLAKPLVPTQVGCCVATRTSRQFLTARIQQCYGKLRRLEIEIFFQKHQLEFIVSQQHFASVECHKEEVQTKFSTVSKERQKKFDALLSKQNLRQKPDKCRVVNLSSKQLTTPQVQVLARGLNFAPAPRCIPQAHIVVSVEAATAQSDATEDQPTKGRIGVIGALSRARLPPRNILPEEMKAVEFAKNEDIIVLLADKGWATVVMDHDDYSSKLLALLEDQDTYQPVDRDPTAALERKMNGVLLNLRWEGHLPGKTYYYLNSSAGQVPCLYGLPKIHKQDVPLHPYHIHYILTNL